MPDTRTMTSVGIQRAVYLALANNARSIRVPFSVRTDPELYQHVEYVLMHENRCGEPDGNFPAICTLEADHNDGHGWQIARVSEISLAL